MLTRSNALCRDRAGWRAARAVCLMLVCSLLLCAPARAEDALSGQSYDAFTTAYQENVTFINVNDGHRLLPLVVAGSRVDVNGARMRYELAGDALTLLIMTDASGAIIESCQITLTAPDSMEYGSARYNDFAVSGYHSYALLMAMVNRPTPLERFDIVNEVNEGLKANNGQYVTQVGAYHLTCVRQGSRVELLFENNRLHQETPEPEETLGPEEDFSQVG